MRVMVDASSTGECMHSVWVWVWGVYVCVHVRVRVHVGVRAGLWSRRMTQQPMTLWCLGEL